MYEDSTLEPDDYLDYQDEILSEHYAELIESTREQDPVRRVSTPKVLDPLSGPEAAWMSALRQITSVRGAAPTQTWLEWGQQLLRLMCRDAVALAGRLERKTAEFHLLECRILHVNEIVHAWWFELSGHDYWAAMGTHLNAVKIHLYRTPEYRALMQARNKARDTWRLKDSTERTKKAERDRRLQKTSARRAADAARKRKIERTPERKAADAARKRLARAAKRVA